MGRLTLTVESKRFEPFRDRKTVSLSDAYDREMWGDRMGAFTTMRDALRAGATAFIHLDAAQLVKHAFGLVTEGRRCRRTPILLYLYAEPVRRADKVIPTESLVRHRAEVAAFASAVAGAEVRFAACSYREWLDGWVGDARQHADALLARFTP